MKSVCLQMIFAGSLLIFSQQATLFTGNTCKCMNETEVTERSAAFRRGYWLRLLFTTPPPPDPRTCEQRAQEMHGSESNRSLSPWRYNLNRDDSRFPHEISFAECVCQGCIINKREDMTYNSVLVYAQMLVMRKTPCRCDPDKYMVKKDAIKVPVACTCVVPKYVK